MNRKYLDDIGIKPEDRPEFFGSEDDGRIPKWQQQKEIYGFDERETWSLNYSFKLWLYERLKMYDEINIVNTGFHKIEYKDKVFTFQECIDRMLEGLKLELTKRPSQCTDEEKEKIDDAIPIFALCHPLLWW